MSKFRLLMEIIPVIFLGGAGIGILSFVVPGYLAEADYYRGLFDSVESWSELAYYQNWVLHYEGLAISSLVLAFGLVVACYPIMVSTRTGNRAARTRNELLEELVRIRDLFSESQREIQELMAKITEILQRDES